MAKCAVEVHLYTSCYEKGDLSSEFKIVEVKYFNTQKEALEFMKRKGGKIQTCSRYKYNFKYTGKTWVEENTGEEREEYYQYILKRL